MLQDLNFEPQTTNQDRNQSLILQTTSVLPDRPDGSWHNKFNLGLWLASATMAQPCNSAIEEAEGVLQTLKEYCSLKSADFTDKVLELGRHYRQRFYEAIQTIFGNIPEESIIFEDNGRTAIFAAIQICQPKHVLSTSEEPGHVTLSLRGDDPWAHIPIEQNYLPANDFFHPQRRRHGDLYERKNTLVDTVQIETLEEKSDDALIGDFVHSYQESLKIDKPIDFVMIPHVSRVGRLLPVRKIALALKDIAKENSREVIIVIDGVQAVGRTYAEELLNPFEYSDIYLFNSAKGVGAQLTSACLLIKPELIKNKLPDLLQNQIYRQYLRNLQISETLLTRDKIDKINNGNFTCVGLTELAGFVGALEAYVQRGVTKLTGESFPMRQSHSDRRKFMMAEMERQRNEVIEKLKQAGISVKDPKSVTIIPHIIILDVPNIRGVQVKKRLQQQDRPITIARLVGEALRIGLPEDPYIRTNRIVDEFIRPLLILMNGETVNIIQAKNQLAMYSDPKNDDWKLGRVDEKLIEYLGKDANVYLGNPE